VAFSCHTLTDKLPAKIECIDVWSTSSSRWIYFSAFDSRDWNFPKLTLGLAPLALHISSYPPTFCMLLILKERCAVVNGSYLAVVLRCDQFFMFSPLPTEFRHPIIFSVFSILQNHIILSKDICNRERESANHVLCCRGNLPRCRNPGRTFINLGSRKK
jgi:hypothetical protein